MMKILGFSVVRLPYLFFNPVDEKKYRTFEPRSVNGVLYSGLFRMEWVDFYDEYYFGMKNEALKRLRRLLTQSVTDLFPYEHLTDFQEALSVLNMSNKHRSFPLNEIIVFRSKNFRQDQLFSFHEKEIEWLGTDLVCYGLGSFVYEGVYWHQEEFSPIFDTLNSNGLLIDDQDCINKYLRFYLDNTNRFELEPINGFERHLDEVQIGRVII